jgi:uncharacterized protein with ParB-like and HNH nuclease domain
MKVDKLPLNRVFDRTERLEAPLFQRPYVWEREPNWEPLWSTIRNMAEARLYNDGHRTTFLGELVLDQLETPLSHIHARQIIDGQQRLTTFQMVLAAARDLCAALGEQRFSQAFRKLTDNDVPLSENPDDIFKVWPTNADRRVFRDTMTAGSKRDILALAFNDALIPQAYLFFYNLLQEWLGSPADPSFLSKLEALHQALREDLHLVIIDLESDDDPQEIFETLNALGTPLLPADLIKNYLFRMAERQGLNPERLNAQYWSRFDREVSFWREEVRQGRLKRPRYDMFVRHYLTLMLKEEVSATELFKGFKRYAGRKPERSACELMQEFRGYGAIYRSFETFSDDSREGLFFYRLEQLDTSTVFPVLLEVLRRFGKADDAHELEQILVDLESFLVRRSVCQLTSKNYNHFFVEMLQCTNAKSAKAIRDFLLASNADSSRWPDDAEFEKAWINVDFYRKVKRSKTRMILEALNDLCFTPKTEKIRIERQLTIEHLMPREWEQHWPLASFSGNFPLDIATEFRNEYVNKIGNLTLLTKSLNPALSNGPWGSKRREILKHSAIHLNRTFFETETWDEEAILKRTKVLLEHALKIWPHPAAN